MRMPAPVKAMTEGIGRARTLGLAAEMSFWVFLSLVPLAAVAGFAAARFVTAKPWMASAALTAVPPQVRTLLQAQVDRVASWRGGAVAPVALATFVWLASSGVAAVFDALEVQSGAKPRAWWKKRLLSIATCVALSVGVALVALLGAGLGWVESLGGAAVSPGFRHAEHGPLGLVLRAVAAALLAVAMTAGLYRVAVPAPGAVPGGEQKRPPTLPGAVLSVVLQGVLGLAYGLYVGKLGGGGDVYQAGLAAVGVTMMTLWLFSIALLLGAQLNSVLAERLRGKKGWSPRPRSAASSSPPTSPKRPTAPSIGPSSSAPASARR